MGRKEITFILCAGLCLTSSEGEIVNYRKSRIKPELQISSPPSEKVKETTLIPALESPKQHWEAIPKPNTPIYEKITVPLTPPSDPARPQAKQPSQFMRPFTQRLITTVNFSLNPENPHKGVVYNPIDSGSVIASREGLIVAIDYMDGYYNYVIIEHADGFYTVYGNLEGVYVAEGQRIKKGEVLGNLVKEKGLYFQVTHGKKILDPISLIKS